MTTPACVPAVLRPMLARAEALAARQDWSGAIAAYERVLAKVPLEPYTLVQLSYMHSLRGNYRRAEDFALAAVRTGTKDEKILAELLPRLRTFNKVPELLACIERVGPLASMPIPLLIAAGAQLSYLNLPERAIAYLDEARRADPDYPTTLLARTQILTYLGRFDDAEHDVERAIRRAPEIAQGYWLRSGLRRQTAERNHVDAIRRELARPGRPAEDIALLSFALHKELDDLQRYDEAWLALMQGCRARRSRLTYDARGMKHLFDALSTFEPADASYDDVTVGPVPIFIVGMHRSGTTLLEQMLAGHPEVAALGELYDFTSAMRYTIDHHCKGVMDATLVARARSADLSVAGKRYLEGVNWRLGSSRYFTDKLPSNFLNIGFIAHSLPQAKILHMVRDPVETCFSNLRELFSDANPYSYDLSELADYYTWYVRLMKHWHSRFPGRILDVQYARLLTDPESELRRVTEFCGLPFDPAMLELGSRHRGVVTASAVQVRNGVQLRDVPKWAPYQRWLGPLLNLPAAPAQS
ncbi:tetratricopeptide repeat-containing sulfotransferase family protein [Steroidobacter sp.]|uniref:tetratricopeptide repeat-containing sulfotransferase family protein n=1 Tax=Steroidobacter sp. TaxID=1978227 RepID=UPI001A4A6E38|nr:sulfotransferase [Steroidobacter sp.]MBL8267534.1 sulfotransferase [Steroidobacter sp.]